MARSWTCRGCAKRNPRLTQRCECGRKRPAPRQAAHLAALDVPYVDYVALNGSENCGACGVPPSPKRRHDRDHDHRTGEPRGLLCVRHNRMLDSRVTPAELRQLADYLERHEARCAA